VVLVSYVNDGNPVTTVGAVDRCAAPAPLPLASKSGLAFLAGSAQKVRMP
jgi:hypothetical protein